MTEAAATSRAALWLAFGAAALWLVVAICRLGDCGPTWDAPAGEYAHGEQYLGYLLTGERAYLEFSSTADDPRPSYPRLEHRAPHPQWPDQLYLWFEAHPLTGLLSAVSCRLLWDTLGWMPALAAHHLPIVLWVALLLAVLVRWAARRWGLGAGAAAGLALLLAPRFLGDAFNNIKDAPEACLYALSVLTFAAALARARPALFALAGALTGLALAQKFNALFIPPQVLLYWVLANLVRRRRGRTTMPFPWLGASIAAAAGLVAWIAVSPMLWTDTLEGVRVYLAYWRRQGAVPFELNRWDGLLAWLWTTPPVLLALAALGACWPRLDSDDRCLLLLGVALPLGRTTLPGAINFDGVRHFLEFQPFLALLAAAGVAWLLELAARLWPTGAASGARTCVLLGVLFAAPAAAVLETWPHGTCYFNAFVGGLGGAQARGIASATDYWASSYWQGMQWLNEHAEPGAKLLVPVAPNVAAAAAPVRLRADLRLLPNLPPSGPLPDVLYVMYVTRRSFYDALAHELDAHDAPFHELQVQGGTILAIHRLAEPAAIEQAFELIGLREATAEAGKRLFAWAHLQSPEVLSALVRAVTRSGKEGRPAEDDEAWRELSALLPPSLQADARLVFLHEAEAQR